MSWTPSSPLIRNPSFSPPISSQIINFASDQITPPWTCCLFSQNNRWRPSMSDMTSRLSLWTYLVLLIQSVILPYPPNSLPVASNANSRHGFVTYSPLITMCGSHQNYFISSPCQGWCDPRQCSGPSPISDLHIWSIWLWKIIFIDFLMTPSSAVTSLILHTGRLQPLPSFQTLTKSQTGHTFGICLSILTNLMLSLALSKRTVCQTVLSTLWTILFRNFSH